MIPRGILEGFFSGMQMPQEIKKIIINHAIGTAKEVLFEAMSVINSDIDLTAIIVNPDSGVKYKLSFAPVSEEEILKEAANAAAREEEEKQKIKEAATAKDKITVDFNLNNRRQ